MKTLYEAYRDKAVILVVYIREAHPANPEQTAENAGWKAIEGTVFHQPKTFEERRKLAETACTFWDLPLPALVDTMEPSVGGSYQAWPNRLYLIDTEGKIVYRGVKGPRGVDVHEGELELRKLLGITEGKPVTEPGRSRRMTTGRGRFSRGGSGATSSKDGAGEGRSPGASQADPAAEESSRFLKQAVAWFRKYDTNEDGKFDEQEWSRMDKTPAKADADADGKISLQELINWLKRSEKSSAEESAPR